MNEFDSIANGILKFKEKSNIEKQWNSFTLDFSTSFDRKKEIYNTINQEIGKTSGLYAIFDDEGCLYIGIGTRIADRIKSHYKAAQGKDNAKNWNEFFQKNNGINTIYWTEFNIGKNQKQTHKIREIIENILEIKYKPKFVYKNDTTTLAINNWGESDKTKV